MKRECGNGSPPLSGDDALGIGTAALEPSATVGPRPGDGKKGDEQQAVGDTDSGRGTNRRHRGTARSRRVDTVLSVISVEGLASSVCITSGNDERTAIEPGSKPMGNAAGCENQGPLIDVSAVGRHSDGSSSEILHRPNMTDIVHEG